MVLGGHVPLGVGSRISQLPALGRDELALPFPVGQEFVEPNSAVDPKRCFGDVRWNKARMRAVGRTANDIRIGHSASGRNSMVRRISSTLALRSLLGPCGT